METRHDDNEDPARGFTLIIVVIAILLLVLAVATYGPVLRYYERQDSQFVGSAGILLAYYGLGLSIAGFGFTWWQLARTQSAAEAAKRAVKKLKNVFGSFDVLLELSTAKTNVDECRQMVAQSSWTDALENYHRIRSSLLKMAAVKSDVDGTIVSRLKDFAAETTGAILDLEAKGRDPNLVVDAASLSATLLAMDELFVELEQTVRDKFSGQ